MRIKVIYFVLVLLINTNINAQINASAGTGIIQIKGNNVIISDGDYTPSVDDSTYFESTTVGKPISNDYQLKHIGIAPAQVTITMKGINPDLFIPGLTGIMLMPGQVILFRITYTPLAVGSHSAIVSIYDSFSQQSLEFMVAGDVYATNVNKQENLNLNIYPNPTNGKIIIDNGECKIDNIEVTDINGRIVYKQSSGNNMEHINLSAAPAGIYFVKVQSGNTIVIKKLMVE